MKIGKWYILFRRGDFAFGFGRPGEDVLTQIERSRPHWPKSLLKSRKEG